VPGDVLGKLFDFEGLWKTFWISFRMSFSLKVVKFKDFYGNHYGCFGYFARLYLNEV